jgi:teichuronic acid biosynthesis glycosyltransferase TuaC
VNILFLSSEFPSPVDPHRAVFNRQMIRGLAVRHRVHVVCPVAWTDVVRATQPTAPPASEPFTAHYPRFYFPPRMSLHRRGAWMWWSVRRSLLAAAERFQPAVVLSYYAHPDGEVALRLARQFGVPVALMVGGSDVLVVTADPRRRERVEAVLRGVDAVVTIGEHLRDRVVAMGVPAQRVTSVMRPVADRFTPGDRAEARRRRGLPTDHAVLLWVGRLVPVKAVDTLIRAVAVLRDRHPKLVVCIAGDGPEGPALTALARQLGVDSCLRWLGAVRHDELPDWYRAADVTVLPSLSEGVPNVLLESIACGTPFVASRVGSIPEIADTGRDRLVTPGQPAELASGIADVLDQRPVAATRSAAVIGDAEFQSRFDDILARCIAAPRPRPQAPGLRSATVVRPRRWRQALRSGLVKVAPRRWLVAAGTADSRAVCLTFDDGPDDGVTAPLLDVLKHHDVRATFFVRGDRASASPAILRRIVDEGHLLGHHSWTHSAPHDTSARRLLAEVRRTRDWLRAQFAGDFTWFRPPHGKVSPAKVAGLWAAGMTIALWNVDPGDVYRTHPRELIDWFAANPPRSGDVVLLHDTSRVTLEALPVLITMIRQAGLDLTTLDRFGGRSA